VLCAPPAAAGPLREGFSRLTALPDNVKLPDALDGIGQIAYNNRSII
jgi:hypothetical protein